MAPRSRDQASQAQLSSLEPLAGPKTKRLQLIYETIVGKALQRRLQMALFGRRTHPPVGSSPSVHPWDAGFLNDPRGLLDVRLEHRGKLLRRAADRLGAAQRLRKRATTSGQMHHLGDLLLHLAARSRAGCWAGIAQAPPGRQLSSPATPLSLKRRHVGQLRRAPRAADGEAAHRRCPVPARRPLDSGRHRHLDCPPAISAA